MMDSDDIDFTDADFEALLDVLEQPRVEGGGHGPVKTLADMNAEERDEMVRLYGPISRETLKAIPRRRRRNV